MTVARILAIAAVPILLTGCGMAPGLIGGGLGYLASVNNVGVEYFKFREDEKRCEKQSP